MHVVLGPPGAELVAAGGQLADEVGQLPVVRVAAGLDAQGAPAVAGDAFPVDPELPGAGVEEREAGGVGTGRSRRPRPRRRARGRAGWRRARRTGCCARTRACRSSSRECRCTPGRTPDCAGRRRTRPGVVFAVRARSSRWACSVSSSCSARATASSTLLGDAAEVAALEAGVVLDADPGQHRDLAAAQPGHPAVGALGGQPGPLRGEPGTARAEKRTCLRAVVHVLQPKQARGQVRGSGVTPRGTGVSLRFDGWSVVGRCCVRAP